MSFIIPPPKAQLIRVTERQEWKDCRRKWYYKYGLGLVQNEQKPDARSMGTAGHAFLEVYKRQIMLGMSHQAAGEAAWDAWYGTDQPQYVVSEDSSSGYPAPIYKGLEPDQIETMEAVLENYLKRYNYVKDGWIPHYVEQRLYAKVPGTKIYITGAVDFLGETNKSGIWIADHKFYSTFLTAEQIEFSDQMNVYMWLCAQNGIKVRGAVYDMIKKKIPTVPKLLKNGTLSKAVGICTDQATYRQAVIDNNLDIADYADHLAVLPESEFFRREWLTRSPAYLKTVEESLTHEVREMMSIQSDLFPNFHRECIYCDFKSICRAQQDKGDVKLVVGMNYHKEESQIGIRRES